MVKGENFNIKVTYVKNLSLIDKLFQLKSIHKKEHKLLATVERVAPNKRTILFCLLVP